LIEEHRSAVEHLATALMKRGMMNPLGEQRRKALELLAPPPSRHDHSDGGIPHQSGQCFEQAFHNRCRKSVDAFGERGWL
jgi:hypothetical protein